MQTENERLILICDGGVHVVQFLINYHIYPSIVLFDLIKFRDVSPYLNKNDSVLFLIHGLVDMNVVEVYALLEELERYKDKIGELNVLSDVALGVIDSLYYMYKGDVFESTLRAVRRGVVSRKEEPRGKNKLFGSSIMEEYTRFNDPKVKMTLHARSKPVVKGETIESPDTETGEQVVFLNIYQ